MLYVPQKLLLGLNSNSSRVIIKDCIKLQTLSLAINGEGWKQKKAESNG